jgi:hypothetical protein
MSDDKVISMDDFRKTEQELNGERPPPEESTVAYTKVMVVMVDEHLLAVVEQGIEDGNGDDEGVSGITLDYDELEALISQLGECKDKMADILLKGGN